MSNLVPHETWQINDSTKINGFMTCPRAFFYTYVLGWKEETPNNHLHFGTCWHTAMEHLLLKGYGDQALNEAYDLLLTEYRSVYPPSSDEIFTPKIPDNALVVLAKYCKEYEKDFDVYKTIYTEIAGTVTVGEDRYLYFRMDSVLERKSDGKVKSREHKTGSNDYLWQEQWPLAFQVGCYNHVLNCMYEQDRVLGVEMNGCLFKKSIKGWAQLLALEPLTVLPPYQFIRFTINKNKPQMQMWLDNANYWFHEIEREYDILSDCTEEDGTLEAFPIRSVSCINYGRVCEYNDFCLAWANPLQKCQLPPPGFVVSHWNPMEAEAKKVFNF